MKKVNQIVSRYIPEEAVSRSVDRIVALLNSLGLPNQVFAVELLDHFRSPIQPLDVFPYSESSTHIIHSHGFDSLKLDFIERLRGKKVLVRHFVPASVYFAPFMGLDYRESVRSRKVLASAVGLFDQVFADSQAAAADLVECGYSQVTVLPNLHVPRSFDVIQSYPSSPFLSFHEPNSTLMLIHAPITPNQRIEDAIRLLSWYCRFIDSKADLVVLGRPIPSDYFLILKDLIHSLSIQSHVHFIRDLHPDGIKACYESADVFLSLAESDCPRFEPLEVSFFDTPSICFDHPDVREVLGDAGLYINRRDIPALSELVALIINQNKFRESIVKKQKERYFSFLKKSSIHELGACLLGS